MAEKVGIEVFADFSLEFMDMPLSVLEGANL
jgi:hypothetical protein